MPIEIVALHAHIQCADARQEFIAMTKHDAKAGSGAEAEKRKTMRDHPRGSLTVPETKLAGGEPIFGVDPGPNIVSPDPHTPPGQTTHE